MSLIATSLPTPTPGTNIENQPRPLVSVPNELDPVQAEQPSHVSLLAEKYLLFAKSPGGASGSGASSSSSKDLQKCINVQTREQFSCKMIPRNAVGHGLLAAYQRLDEFSDSILPIHEIVLTPKVLHIMFQINYGNLHSYILSKKKLAESETARLFKQIVSAVQYCHGKGIVLRDLKMGKFVFSDRERNQLKLETLEDVVVLSDLSDDELSDQHGCPNYVSPEKADSLRTKVKYPGKATDIWGLGIMLYTMLVGKYPFDDPDRAKLFVLIMKGVFTIPENLSHSVKSLLRSLLSTEPSGRPNCERILRHPWIVNNGLLPPRRIRIARRMGVSNSRRRTTATVQPQPSTSNTVVEEDDDQIVPGFKQK